ncbi:MAG: hypothetical protein QNJ46_29170 [Leptolyngbyaceae cyanobacterium MO_188.B28]|nr:hypothetical protein [Leptolyngbyaceae cyanobacterium MO_188.B28]
MIRTEFDDVFVGPMLKRLGQAPYQGIANPIAQFSRDAQANPNGSSPPSVIADAILKAPNTRRPRTRYAAGKFAKPMLFVRQWGGDRVYNWVLGKMLS